VRTRHRRYPRKGIQGDRADQESHRKSGEVARRKQRQGSTRQGVLVRHTPKKEEKTMSGPVPDIGKAIEEFLKLVLKFVFITAGVLIVIAIIFTRTPIETNWILILGFAALGVLLALILDAVRGVRDELRKQPRN